MKTTTKTQQYNLGDQFLVTAGSRVTRNGERVTQQRTRYVTIREIAPARNNKTRVTWKSGGYYASVLV